MRRGRRAFIKLGSDSVHNAKPAAVMDPIFSSRLRAAYASNDLNRYKWLPAQTLSPVLLQTFQTIGVARTLQKTGVAQAANRYPVLSVEGLVPTSSGLLFADSFQLNIRPVRLKLKCDRKVAGIASAGPNPDVVSSRYPARLVGNEDVPRCVPLVSIQHSRIRSRMTSNALRPYFPSKALCQVARAGIKTPPYAYDPPINSGAMQLRAVVVADNEGMQLRIDSLTARVQELERALQDAQRSTSSSNDPMMEDSPTSPSSAGPSSVDNGSDRESHGSYGEGHASYPYLHSPTRFPGTLSLGTAGDARFFGPTARSDYLAHVRGAGSARFDRG